MNLDILGSNLREVCEHFRWITDHSICERLRANVDQGTAAFRRRDHAGLTAALGGFLDALEQGRGTGGGMNDNAYWLLKVNGEYLRSHL